MAKTTRSWSSPATTLGRVVDGRRHRDPVGLSWPLADVVKSVPTAVSGGLSIYLFGVIGMQGIALMMAEKVNLFDPKQLAIGAVILIVGIGGNIGYPGGFIPFPILQGLFPRVCPPSPPALWPAFCST